MRTALRRLPAQLWWVIFAALPVLSILNYTVQYGRAIPMGDEWVLTSPFALQVASGTAAPADFFMQEESHRSFFHRLVVGVLVWTTGWELKLEMYLNFGLALGSLALALLLFRRFAPKPGWIGIAALLMSPLVFSISQYMSWTWALISSSFITMFCMLAALWLVSCPERRTATRLIVAALLCALASFSILRGLFTWGGVLLALALLGFRRWYGFWAAAAAATLLLFLNGYVFVGGDYAALARDIGSIVVFTLANIGNPFVFFDIPLAAALGVMGMALLLINAWALWRRDRTTERIAVWAGLAAFVTVTAALTAQGRAGLGLHWAIDSRYVTFSLWFWVALAALALYQISGAGGVRGLALVNVVVLVGLAGLYLSANVRLQQVTPFVLPEEEACIRNYPWTRDIECSGYQRIGFLSAPLVGGMTDQFAAARLNVFNRPRRAALPAAYVPGTPIVVEAPYPWQHIGFEHGDQPVDEGAIFRLWQPEREPTVPMPYPQSAAVDANDTPLQVRDFVDEAESFWLFRTNDQPNYAEALMADITPDYGIVPLAAAPEQVYPQMIYYRRIPQEAVPIRFGDSVRLEAWTLQSSVDVHACDTISLSSWWAADVALPTSYSLTLVLADAAGVGRVQSDGAPANLLTGLWTPGQRYVDERSLTLPCDLEPGAYALLIGWYDPATLVNLPTSGGGLAYLTTLYVAP